MSGRPDKTEGGGERRCPGDLEVLGRRAGFEPQNDAVAREGQGGVDHAVGQPVAERVRRRPLLQRGVRAHPVVQAGRRLVGDDELAGRIAHDVRRGGVGGDDAWGRPVHAGRGWPRRRRRSARAGRPLVSRHVAEEHVPRTTRPLQGLVLDSHLRIGENRIGQSGPVDSAGGGFPHDAAVVLTGRDRPVCPRYA